MLVLTSIISQPYPNPTAHATLAKSSPMAKKSNPVGLQPPAINATPGYTLMPILPSFLFTNSTSAVTIYAFLTYLHYFYLLLHFTIYMTLPLTFLF